MHHKKNLVSHFCLHLEVLQSVSEAIKIYKIESAQGRYKQNTFEMCRVERRESLSKCVVSVIGFKAKKERRAHPNR